MKIQVLFGALALAAWFWVASDEAYRVSWEKDRRVVGHRRFNVFFWETSEPLPPGATRRAWQAALARYGAREHPELTKGGTEVRLERMFGTNAAYVLKAKTRRIEPVVAFYAKDLPGAEMERGMNSYRIASHRRDARGYLEGPWAMLYARRLEGDEWEVELQLHQPRESAPESLDP